MVFEAADGDQERMDVVALPFDDHPSEDYSMGGCATHATGPELRPTNGWSVDHPLIGLHIQRCSRFQSLDIGPVTELGLGIAPKYLQAVAQGKILLPLLIACEVDHALGEHALVED